MAKIQKMDKRHNDCVLANFDSDSGEEVSIFVSGECDVSYQQYLNSQNKQQENKKNFASRTNPAWKKEKYREV